jgi:hypothetical protein
MSLALGILCTHAASGHRAGIARFFLDFRSWLDFVVRRLAHRHCDETHCGESAAIKDAPEYGLRVFVRHGF